MKIVIKRNIHESKIYNDAGEDIIGNLSCYKIVVPEIDARGKLDTQVGKVELHCYADAIELDVVPEEITIINCFTEEMRYTHLMEILHLLNRIEPHNESEYSNAAIKKLHGLLSYFNKPTDKE